MGIIQPYQMVVMSSELHVKACFSAEDGLWFIFDFVLVEKRSLLCVMIMALETLIKSK